MKQCNRCGEPNHDDAQYCGTCGLAIPTSGSIESLVTDDADPHDQTSSGQGRGHVAGASSEHVGAPSFGETGSVVEPGPVEAAAPTAAPALDATTVQSVAPPPGQPPSEHTVPRDGAPGAIPMRSSTSTSIMIAALAVAAVVIIGGVFILLASGSSGDDTARTGDGTATPQTSDPGVAPAVSPTPTDPPVDTATPTAVGPATSEVAAPVVTSAASTAPEATTPDTTAPPTAPTRAPGDLGLEQPILNEQCDGRYITFVGSAIGDRPYDVVVDELLGLYPGTNYIWTKACPSLRQEFTDGADIYGVVFGPYPTREEACDARAFGPEDAYVRRISTVDPQDHTILC